MPDATTLVFGLAYFGTLAIAGLMFLGQLVAFTALLALAACGHCLTVAARALLSRKANNPPNLGRHMSGAQYRSHQE